jgi:predicted nucleic acid-binding protein
MYTFNPLRNVWLPIILVDELWFYTILYTVARHLDASSQFRSHEREVSYLADALIKRLRSRLERSSGGVGLTDIDCAAVACLLGIEASWLLHDFRNCVC